MEINKTIINSKKYIMIKLNRNEFVSYLDCIKSKFLKPPKPDDVDIGDEIYLVLRDDVAKELGKKLIGLKGKWVEVKIKEEE